MVNQLQNNYCYLDVRSQLDLVVTIIYLAFFTILMAKIIRAYYISKKYIQPGTIFRVYYFLAAWYIAYVIQYIYGTVIYLTKELESIQKKQLRLYSAIFQFMDFLPAFLLMGCLFLVSSLLFSRILTLSQSMGSNPTKFQILFSRFIKFYQLFRILFIIPTIMLFVMVQYRSKQTNPINICSKIELAFYLLDSVICNMTLCIVMTTMRHKNQQLKLSNQKQKLKLRRQTILLQFAGFSRFVLGLIFVFLNDFNIQFLNQQDKCPKGSTFRSIFYMIIGQLIMHALPIGVILSIFSISQEQVQQALSQHDLSIKLDDDP